jgi:signal transduction histidine kinase
LLLYVICLEHPLPPSLREVPPSGGGRSSMRYIFGLLIFAWVSIQQVFGPKTDIWGIAATLGALCLFIVKEKYLARRVFASVACFVAAAVLYEYWPTFLLLAAIPLLDFAYGRNYWLGAPALALACGLAIAAGEYWFTLLFAAAACAGWLLGEKERGEEAANGLLDGERRLRYNLEQAQNELLQSRRDVEALAEARERNRIAHELHDSIGHGVAGVLVQLEAALRIHGKDADKTEEILRACTGKLAETLTLTRNAVYNIRSDVKTGVEALENIISGFKYCPVAFAHSGDFANVSASNMRILEANVREALTNSARHSHATQISVSVDIRRHNVRLQYRDNGVGCGDIRESMGLIGMRERVRNAGGTISIDGSDGFLIVCNLPGREGMEEGGAT